MSCGNGFSPTQVTTISFSAYKHCQKTPSVESNTKIQAQGMTTRVYSSENPSVFPELSPNSRTHDTCAQCDVKTFIMQDLNIAVFRTFQAAIQLKWTPHSPNTEQIRFPQIQYCRLNFRYLHEALEANRTVIVQDLFRFSFFKPTNNLASATNPE